MAQEQNSRKIIYLAEDDDDDSILFQEALSELNPDVAVKVSEDGQQLLNNLYKMESGTPEIIFLDINMPCKNGFECLKEIRSCSCFDAVKVIMFSTSSSTLHIELSYRLGADLYAVKPGPYQELKELLQDVLAADWKRVPRNRSEFLAAGRKRNAV